MDKIKNAFMNFCILVWLRLGSIMFGLAMAFLNWLFVFFTLLTHTIETGQPGVFIAMAAAFFTSIFPVIPPFFYEDEDTAMGWSGLFILPSGILYTVYFYGMVG